MKQFYLLFFAYAGLLFWSNPVTSQTPASHETHRELSEARKTAWEWTKVIVEKLEPADQTRYPGTRAWLKDFHKATHQFDLNVSPEKWPSMDVDTLVSRNPNFWQAYFEIAPGDPGMMLLHATLLLSAGEATRASYVVVVAEQRPGIPKSLRPCFESILIHAQKVAAKPTELVQQGIHLHDQGDYEGALKKYQEALALWSQHSMAHYEKGFTLYCQEAAAAGEKVPVGNRVIINGGRKQSAKVMAEYNQARRHDPMQLHAYQGEDREVIDALMVLVKTGIPAWEKLVKNRQKFMEREPLQTLAESFQQANIHELALPLRQILVARRGRFDPSDHPFITTSLRKLVPGPQTEGVLKLLAGEKLELRQLVVPDASVDETSEAKTAALKQLRLYVPGPEMSQRVGKDIQPLAAYIKALEKTASSCLEKEELSKAKGILIAIGIKPGKKARVWCQNVEGDVPEEILRKLEDGLAKVETISVNGTIAFGMEVEIRGRSVALFPEFPSVWLEAARKSGTRVIVPPDELFKIIWAD